jgi:hypothetical protein
MGFFLCALAITIIFHGLPSHLNKIILLVIIVPSQLNKFRYFFGFYSKHAERVLQPCILTMLTLYSLILGYFYFDYILIVIYFLL